MSTRAFRFQFQDRGKNGGGLPAIIGGAADILGVPDLIEDILGRLGGGGQGTVPARPTLPTKVQGPVNGGAVFQSVGCQPGNQSAMINGKPCCPSGMHFSQSSGCCVRNRRMNFQNGRAFNRAVRRVAGKARWDARARKAVGKAAREMGCIKPSRARRSSGCSKCK